MSTVETGCAGIIKPPVDAKAWPIAHVKRCQPTQCNHTGRKGHQNLEKDATRQTSPYPGRCTPTQSRNASWGTEQDRILKGKHTIGQCSSNMLMDEGRPKTWQMYPDRVSERIAELDHREEHTSKSKHPTGQQTCGRSCFLAPQQAKSEARQT